MYLARRVFGQPLRVYPVDTREREPRAWFCDFTIPGGGTTAASRAAAQHFGVAATGFTRSEAITNLHAAEEAAQHA